MRRAIIILFAPMAIALWMLGWVLYARPAKREKQVQRDPALKLQSKQET